jgi:hypothetical protein
MPTLGNVILVLVDFLESPLKAAAAKQVLRANWDTKHWTAA